MRLRQILNAVFPRLPERAAVDLQEWREIKPGGVMMLEDKEGHRWALLHEDDFEHVLALARLQMTRVSETVNGNPDASG